MITRVGAAARRAGMTLEDFQTHWHTSHGPTAGVIPHLVRYIQYHAVLRNGRPLTAYPGFDACSELDFASFEMMDEGFELAAEQGELKADEDRFVDKTRYSWVLGTSEVRLGDMDPLSREEVDPVVLVRWLRRHPSASIDEFGMCLLGEWEDAVEASGATTRRLVFADHDAHNLRGAASADVVEFIGFADVEAALQAMSGELVDAAPVLAGSVFGVAEHLARPIVIVDRAEK